MKEEIAKSLKTNIEYGAGVYKSPDGILEVRWLPDENTGFIDIKNPENLKFSELKSKSLKYINNLPEGRWEMNPDTPQKGRIYKRLFGDITESNPDMPNNALIMDTSKTPDLSKYSSQTAASSYANKNNITEYTYNGKLLTKEGKKGQFRVKKERQASQQRPSPDNPNPSRYKSQLAKEERRRNANDRFEPLTKEEEQINARNRAEWNKKGLHDDHIAGKANYSEGRINHPENRQPLDPKINTGIKVVEEKELSRGLLKTELNNPSKSMPLEKTLELASHRPKYYQDILENAKEVKNSFTALETETGLNRKAFNLGESRRLAKQAAKTGSLIAYGGLGTTVSAFETDQRRQIAQYTGNIIDYIQWGLSGFSLGADIASYAPPAAVKASIASGIADVLNQGIDTTRGIVSDIKRGYKPEKPPEEPKEENGMI